MKYDPKILSKEIVVAVEILAASEESDDPIHFNSLVERLEAKKFASRTTVSRALDMLFDQGIVRAEWVQRKRDGRHIRALTIAGEAQGFIKEIHQRMRD